MHNFSEMPVSLWGKTWTFRNVLANGLMAMAACADTEAHADEIYAKADGVLRDLEQTAEEE